MFSFNFNFFARSTTLPLSEEPLPLTPDSKVISISRATDDFVDVDFKKLSYAEVAALSRSVKIANYDKGKDIKVIDETELGTDVSDVQMATTLSKSKSFGKETKSKADTPLDESKDAVISALEEDELVLDTLYNDKGNRFPLKKYKKKVYQKKARRSS